MCQSNTFKRTNWCLNVRNIFFEYRTKGTFERFEHGRSDRKCPLFDVRSENFKHGVRGSMFDFKVSNKVFDVLKKFSNFFSISSLFDWNLYVQVTLVWNSWWIGIVHTAIYATHNDTVTKLASFLHTKWTIVIHRKFHISFPCIRMLWSYTHHHTE